MSLVEVPGGDLFHCGMQTIACPVNAAGAMGAGLAKTFRDTIPGLYRFYQTHYPRTDDPFLMQLNAQKLRVFQVAPDRQVLLFPTKVHWTDPAQLVVIEENLLQLSEQWQALGIRSLGLPMLGCGLGQLNYWRTVRPFLQLYLSRLPIDVHVMVER